MVDYLWSLSTPTNSVTIGSLPGHIRDVKDQVATALDKEHTARANGTGNDDIGWEHKEGSAMVYVDASSPALRPDGTTSLTSTDEGRLWVDTDDDSVRYYDGSAWVEIALAGGATGNGVVLLDGRAGGQVVNGGTVTTDGLTFYANAAADSTGTILFEGANAAAIDFDAIPASNLKAGSAVDLDSNLINNMADAVSDGDGLALGAAVITFAELASTGGVASSAYGSASPASAANFEADIGFAPDFVIAMNTSAGNDGQRVHVWVRGMGDVTIRLASGLMRSGGNEAFTVSGNVITFITTNEINVDGDSFTYFAVKSRKTVSPT